MLPVLTNPSTCEYEVRESYVVGDIVFCRVKGRYIDAHFVHAVQGDRYLIGNNHGHMNGWTKTIYGRVCHALDEHGRTQYVRGHRD